MGKVPCRFPWKQDPNARADCGKIAVTKDPLVYCLEEIDNGKNLSELYIDTKQKIEEKDSEIFGGITELLLKGKRIEEAARDGCVDKGAGIAFLMPSTDKITKGIGNVLPVCRNLTRSDRSGKRRQCLLRYR